MDEHAQRRTGHHRRTVLVGTGVMAAALAGTTVLAACSGSQADGGAGAGSSTVAAGTPSPAPDPGYRSGTGSVSSGALTPDVAGQPASGDESTGANDSGAGSGGAKSPEQLAAGTGVLADRSIVRTASMTVRAKDVLVASAQASSLAQALGGFVSGEKTQASPDQPAKSEAVIALRVPADRMPTLLTQLRGLGTLLSEDQSADDVTGQVIDVAARIAAQKASVARIRVLMSRATTLGQVVQIEGELTTRQAALESLEGQAAALADQTTLATVTATIVGPQAAAPVVRHTTAPSGFGAGLSKGWHAFTVAGSWLLTALGVLLPFLVLVTPFVLAGYVLARRRSRSGAPATTASEPPPAAA